MIEPFAGPALLFCPADRPDRFGKAAAAADVVILDLEDGVALTDKPAARRHLCEVPLDPDRTVVRINPVDTADHELDLAALAGTNYRTVMLAKAETAGSVRQLGTSALRLRVIALCETALGVLNAAELAAEPATLALMWGAEDLLVSLGGRSSRRPDGRYRDVAGHARNQVLLAAGGYGRAAIDAVYLNIADLDGLRGEAEDAAASGFAAKACIHPSQAAVVRRAWAPSEAELTWAARVLRAAEGSAGVFSFEGRMVDQPILSQARRLLRAANLP
ncbi:MAG TPA: CoA ester lyase [Kineosporiaceae bacterium]|nr:CoA ester lyase [Kineosporiaceae bacterium]